jgi:hypothetical protein
MRADTEKQRWTIAASLVGYRLAPGVGWCWIMDKVPEELASILREVEKALEAKLYYLAIAVALSIPDICSCLEFDPEQPQWQNRKSYVEWCKKHITGFQNLDGDDLYNLRGGVLHKGKFDHPKSKWNRVMFIGEGSSILMHDRVITIQPHVEFGGVSAKDLRIAGRVLGMSAVKFCQTISSAARVWIISESENPNVQRNLPLLVRFRPEGLPPFSVGIPTIA